MHNERGHLVNFVGVQNDVTERKQAKEKLKRAYAELGEWVRQRTARLAGINAELQREIAERQVLEEQLTHQAFHDPLTGLPHQTLFIDRLDLALGRAKQRKGKVAVLFMDLDDFKVINDSLGHEARDQVLLAVAERLELEADLRRALKREEFKIHYQPKVSFGSGEIVAMEALIR